jgi:hypothetical protein
LYSSPANGSGVGVGVPVGLRVGVGLGTVVAVAVEVAVGAAFGEAQAVRRSRKARRNTNFFMLFLPADKEGMGIFSIIPFSLRQNLCSNV